MPDPFASLPTALRTVVITGGNSGLGYACAHALLAARAHQPPWHVVLACRDPGRARDAVERLRQDATGRDSVGHVEAMSLDLASLDSVRGFTVELARRVAARELPPLHALVCNAGVQNAGKQTFTADGFESTFGVNHLGHFLLVNILLPQFASPARVVVVASGTHDPAQKTGTPAPAWNHPVALAKGDLGPMAAKDTPFQLGQRSYTTSKLANVLFSHELARRLPPGITTNAFDPGLMPGTNLIREAPAPLRFLWAHVLPRILPLLRRFVLANVHTIAESGAALARLVDDPGLDATNGKYFEGTREIPSSVDSYDEARAAELWQGSAELTRLV